MKKESLKTLDTLFKVILVLESIACVLALIEGEPRLILGYDMVASMNFIYLISWPICTVLLFLRSDNCILPTWIPLITMVLKLISEGHNRCFNFRNVIPIIFVVLFWMFYEGPGAVFIKHKKAPSESVKKPEKKAQRPQPKTPEKPEKKAQRPQPEAPEKPSQESRDKAVTDYYASLRRENEKKAAPAPEKKPGRNEAIERQRAEEKARREEEARRRAEEKALLEAEQRIRSELEAKLRAEYEAKLQAELREREMHSDRSLDYLRYPSLSPLSPADKSRAYEG